MLACGPQNANNDVREPKWLRMARMKTGSDGDEYEDEDDNDGKADDYDGGAGDNKSLHVQQQRMYVPSASRQSFLPHSWLCSNAMHLLRRGST